ncbi:hypothetical protein M3Y97_01137900 [Aphelenchoides bicaudatus]|nr:hypothetical protein M3Y97_01137900 [Aphelenchoides bicaudatus]
MELFLEPNFGKIQFWSDVVGCFLGAVVTSVLIWTIFRATDQRFKEYSHLILISAIFDLFLALVQLCTQHQIVFIDNILYVMPQSPVECRVFEHFGSIFVFFHVFTTFYGLLILPGSIPPPVSIDTFNFSGHASSKNLARNLFLTVMVGFGMAFIVYLSTKKSLARGRDYYLAFIPETPIYQNVRNEFLYVNDPEDWETAVFFKGLFHLNLLSYLVVLFYAFKSWRWVNSIEKSSKKTKGQQKQFSMCLLMQTFNTTVFAFIPMSLPSVALVICEDVIASGFWTMVLFSWLPFSNSISIFFIVTKYREYVLSFVFKASKTKPIQLEQLPTIDTSLKRKSIY